MLACVYMVCFCEKKDIFMQHCGLVCMPVCVWDRDQCQVNCFSIFYLHFCNSILLNLEFTAVDRSSR